MASIPELVAASLGAGPPASQPEGHWTLLASRGGVGFRVSVDARGEYASVKRGDLFTPRGRWTVARSARPDGVTLWQADDDECYVLLTPAGAEVLQGELSDAEVGRLLPPEACRAFLELEARCGQELGIDLDRRGAALGRFRIARGDADSLWTGDPWSEDFEATRLDLRSALERAMDVLCLLRP